MTGPSVASMYPARVVVSERTSIELSFRLVPPGAGLDLEPIDVVGDPQDCSERHSETVGHELHRQVEQLVLILHLERVTAQVGDHALLPLPHPELLEARRGSRGRPHTSRCNR